MPYPETIDRFPEKLNKKTDGSVYVIEEELPVENGVYEGLLAHDNISNNSIRVFSGPKLTGNEIANVMVSIPGDTPWRRHIKIFAGVPLVYVSYETPGDTVEADDVNVLQSAITATQTEIERIKSQFVHIQSTPAAVWTITHNLSKYPSVTIVDSANSVVVGEVRYLSVNQVRVSFSAAFSGKAYFN